MTSGRARAGKPATIRRTVRAPVAAKPASRAASGGPGMG
jgi:hypothetical protein